MTYNKNKTNKQKDIVYLDSLWVSLLYSLNSDNFGLFKHRWEHTHVLILSFSLLHTQANMFIFGHGLVYTDTIAQDDKALIIQMVLFKIN